MSQTNEPNNHPEGGYTLYGDGIPDVLKERPQWVAWRAHLKTNGRIDKVPVDPNTGDGASSTDPYTWGTFNKAFERIVGDKLYGVGYVFSSNDPFFGVDLDDCRNPKTGEIKPWAMKIIERFGTYAEVSPSGTGVKLIGVGKVPRGRKKGLIEVYDRGRFFTLTGNRLEGAPKEAMPAQESLDKLYSETFEEDSCLDPAASTSSVRLSDEEVLKLATKARNGDKFRRLWEGDTEGYPSTSEADLALVNILAFYAGGDREQIERLFRKSSLMRPKWNEPHYGDGRTYGEATIEKALSSRGPDDFYLPSESETDEESEKLKGSAADRLVAYALEAVSELFVDQFGAPHIFVEDKPLPLNSRCHGWLRRLMWEREGKVVNADALKTAAGTLAAFAEGSGVVRELHTRAAFHEGALYYELGPSRMVRVDASGWGFEPEPPVLFRRLANLKPLPDPEAGGNVEDLGHFVNLKTERDRRLFCAYLVTLALPHIGRPILLATGLMGAGKSTTSRVIKRLWDPTEPEAIRTDSREFLQKASHCFLVMLDNQSKFSEEMADTLCRLVTGEADSKRKLYSDDEDIVYSLMRGILLNGINVPTERGDVLDRSLAIELDRLPDTERRTEEELWAYFEVAHPKFLGEAFRLLSEAIVARPRVALTHTPRLADWGYYAAGVYEALGWGAKQFLSDWEEVVEVQEQATLEGSPVAQAILLFMDGKSGYEGTATDLYKELIEVAFKHEMKIERDKEWPKSARWLWRRTKEVLPLLASRGVIAERVESRAGTLIKLSAKEEAA